MEKEQRVMSTNAEIRDVLIEKDSKELIELGFAMEEQLQDIKRKFEILKFILRQRMEQDKAKAIFHPIIKCTAKIAATRYDKLKLTPLKEIFSDEELKEHGYRPAYSETRVVPESWDMRKIKGLSQFGNHIKDILDKATILGDIIDVEFKGK
jgi:hypothetical protein